MRPSADRVLVALAAAALVALSIAASFRKIWASDFWWQHATGAWVLGHGWPTGDVFSYTAAGRPWIELRWLYCVAQYSVMETLGPWGLELAKWLAVVAAFGLLARPWLRGRTLAPALLVLTAALLASSQRLFVRPELVTYVLIAVFVRVLDRHRRRGGRALWLLPALQLVWVNAHTMFIYGPLLVGLLLAAETAGSARRIAAGGAAARAAARRLGEIAAVLALTGAACLVNPWGLAGASFPLRLFTELRGTAFKAGITELLGPFDYGPGFAAVGWYVALIAAAGASLLINLRRVDPFWLGLAASQLYLSWLSIRNLPLFALAAIPFVLSNLERSGLAEAAWLRRAGPWPRRATLGAVALLAGAYAADMATNRFHVRQGDTNRFGIGIAEYRYPVAAADFLDREALDGPVFSTMQFNSYLIARGRKVFLDPRIEVYGEALFERFVRIQRDAGAWEAAVRDYDLRVVIAPLQSTLAELARDAPDWLLVDFDPAAAVFVRADAAAGIEALDTPDRLREAVERVRARLPPPRPRRRLGPVDSPRPYLAVADFLIGLSLADAAEAFVADAATADPRAAGLELRRAALAELRGDWEAAARWARAGLERRPGDPQLELRLGTAQYRLRELEPARVLLERSLERRPLRARTWAMLGSIDAIEGRNERAAERLARAVELEPQNAEFVGTLARVQARLGHHAAAIEGLERALRLAPGDAGLRGDLAQLYLLAGDEAAARRQVEQGLASSPGDPALRELARRLGPPDQDGSRKGRSSR